MGNRKKNTVRIGFYYAAQKHNGGIYQYTNTLLQSVLATGVHVVIFAVSKDLQINHPNAEVVNLIETHAPHEGKKRNRKSSYVQLIKNTLLKLRLFPLIHILTLYNARARARKIEAYELDIIIFPNTTDASAVVKTPSILVIHDLQHKINPQFPEVNADGQHSWRELMYRKSIEKARIIVAESDIGRQYIQAFYGVPSERIVVLPYLPPDYLQRQTKETLERVKKEFNLPDRFLFYPAQMWPHKNHTHIIKAVHLLNEKEIKACVVFSGSKKEVFGVYKNMESLVETYGLQDQVMHLGYVDTDVMSALYQLAEALIMPTSFGPSNIPILEAWAMDCPVIYSNVRGCVEQAGDAALLCDPQNPHDIAAQIQILYQNPEARQELIRKGKERLASWTKHDFSVKVSKMLDRI